MMKKPTNGLMLFIFIVTTFFSFCFFPQTNAQAEVVFISNSSVTIDSLTKLQIKDIFLGSLAAWDDGQEIKFVLLKKSATHKEFTKKYTNKSESQFRRTWKQIVFTGKGSTPKSFKSESDLVAYVGKTEGAIGYVSSGTPVDGVKTITVFDN